VFLVGHHTSPAQIKEIAAARVRDTGYDVNGTDPCQLALQIRPTGNVWVAMLLLPNGPSPFHLFIEDATGNAEYLAPIVKAEVLPQGDNSDWLIKVDSVLKHARYPIELETLKRAAYFTDSEFSMGGSENGRTFLDYTIRQDGHGPARFDLRCFVTEPEGDGGPKMVTAAEIAYWDAKVYRYRLVRDS
jgi:hypothetical protein